MRFSRVSSAFGSYVPKASTDLFILLWYFIISDFKNQQKLTNSPKNTNIVLKTLHNYIYITKKMDILLETITLI